jgi:hypothetical protein
MPSRTSRAQQFRTTSQQNDYVRTPRLHPTRKWFASFAIVGLLVAAVALPAGAQTDGHVTGSLRLSPGTSVTATVAKAGLPVSGRVVFKPATGREIVVGVGKSGEFNLNLRPGTYTAFGGGREWFPNCHGDQGKAFKIMAGRSFNVTVWCIAL